MSTFALLALGFALGFELGLSRSVLFSVSVSVSVHYRMRCSDLLCFFLPESFGSQVSPTSLINRLSEPILRCCLLVVDVLHCVFPIP